MLLSPSVRACFDAQVVTFDCGAYWDCLLAAATLARLLRAEGHAPWIGRMRWTEMQDGVEVRWPLIARRLRARPAWTTHYVCVVSGVVVDPAAGEPMPLDGYGRALFGVDLVVECHIATNQLQDYLDAAATRR